MELSKNEKKIFEKTLEDARKEVDRFDEEIEDELKKTRERLMELEVKRESISQLYSASATLLGVEVDLPDEINRNFMEQVQ